MREKKQEISIYLSIIFGNLGSKLLTFIIGLYILKDTESALNFGLSQTVGPLVGLALLPFLAGIIDKYDKKIIMLIGQSISIVALIIYLFINYYFVESLLVNTYFLLIGLNIADQVLYNCFQASVVNLVETNRVQRVKSIQQVINAIIMVLTPVIGAFLYAHISLKVFVIAEIVFEILALLAIMAIDFNFVNEGDINQVEEDENILKMTKDGFKYIGKYNKLIFGLSFAMVLNFLLGGYLVGLPVMQVKILDFSDEMYGITQGVFAVGLIASGVFLSIHSVNNYIEKVRNASLIMGLDHIFLGAMIYFVRANTSLFAVIIIFNMTLGACLSVANILMTTWASEQLPAKMQGRVFSILSVCSQLLLPLGLMTYSILFDHVKPSIIMLANGLIITFLVIYLPVKLKIDIKDDRIED